MSKEDHILGLDIGSSSVRGALFDVRGNIVRHTFVQNERRLKAVHGGGSELDAGSALRQVTKVIDGVMEQWRSTPGKIVSIASCSFWHSLVGVDENGRPTTPVYGWADNRSREYVGLLRKRFNEIAVHDRTGCRFHSSYWPAKLFWLRKECPEVWARTAHWISFSDLLMLLLCGSAITDVSMVSGTGLFDIWKYRWDPELARFLKIKQNMLPVIATEVPAPRPLLQKWLKRWPLLKEAKFFPTVADGAANNIGCGAVGKETAALMLGTSGAIRVIYEGRPPQSIPSGLFCYRLDKDRIVLGGALSDGGGLYDHLKQLLRLEIPDAAIGKEIAGRGADAHGLTFLPFFAGERSTGYNEFATGSIHSLTMAHDVIDILQASMESVAYRLADISDQLNSVKRINRIIASGGALTALPVWTQIISDVLGRDLIVSNEPEASLRGAVLLALATTGKIELADKKSAEEELKINFHPECHSVYKKARKRHLRIIGTLPNSNK